MRRLSREEFDQLCAGAQILAADEHGPKVLLTPNDRIIKLFRRKRLLSSALWNPYAARFDRACRELATRSVPATLNEMTARVPHLQRDFVMYPRLDGVPLREALARATHEQRDALVDLLANVLALLHSRGVYFRAAHFGNFLVQELDDGAAQRLALIDVSEARFVFGALSPTMRARNFRPLTSYAEDLGVIREFGVDRFIQVYLCAARLSPAPAKRFRRSLRRVHAAFL